MNWWINIGILKLKSGKYFIVDIPKEMKDVGYEEECYEEDSKLFEEYEINKLRNADYGYYSLTLKAIDEDVSYSDVLERAKQGEWTFFSIENFVKRI